MAIDRPDTIPAQILLGVSYDASEVGTGIGESEEESEKTLEFEEVEDTRNGRGVPALDDVSATRSAHFLARRAYTPVTPSRFTQGQGNGQGRRSREQETEEREEEEESSPETVRELRLRAGNRSVRDLGLLHRLRLISGMLWLLRSRRRENHRARQWRNKSRKRPSRKSPRISTACADTVGENAVGN